MDSLENLNQQSPDESVNISTLSAKLNESTYFPLLSLFSALFIITFLIISTEPTLADYFQIPDFLINFEFKLFLLCIVGLVFFFDANRYAKRKQKSKFLFEKYNKQLNVIWEGKKQQQLKANKYSDHTEKLKLFISDKLLEHIEYDEKFLHFKGIAAEIRHNGVISYDKVVTALDNAIEQQHFLGLYEKAQSAAAADNDSPNQQTLNALVDYQNAIDAMRYLWDLLDLSTADNMALHIGNRLIECEEHYYQLNLDSHKQLDSTQSIPVSPTFYPQMAALMTLSMQTGATEIRTIISLAKINHSVLLEKFHFESAIFRCSLQPCQELLGNPNHIILLLENLIKNALFFQQKAITKQKTDRIALQLFQFEGFVRLVIYNRGPHVAAADFENIFKLGYSTRRNKQHHGKGLGLFFCKEIVDGYQGSIVTENIMTPRQSYQLSLLLASGEEQVYQIEVDETDDGICASISGNTNNALYQKEISLQCDIPIKSITLCNPPVDSPPTMLTLEIQPEQAHEWLDPSESFKPRWIIQVNIFKKSHKLVFKPLDISGVEFSVNLPTAESRVNDYQLDFSIKHQ